MIKFTTMDEDGNEVEHELPAKMEVCSRCQGYGTHLTPSIGEHAYSMEEFEESFSTDEEKEDYFTRGGAYDVSCEVCDGKRVEEVVDDEACSEEPLKALLDKYYEVLADQYACQREREAEMRFGC